MKKHEPVCTGSGVRTWSGSFKLCLCANYYARQSKENHRVVLRDGVLQSRFGFDEVRKSILRNRKVVAAVIHATCR